MPKSLHIGFIFTPKNICVICADCNQIKRNQETLAEIPDTVTHGARRRRYPRVSGAFLIVHPHFDVYDDHILETNGYYIDKSTKGHFTIGACKLNRKLHEFGSEINNLNDAELSDVMNNFLDEKDFVKRAAHLKKLQKLLILT